MLRLNRQFRKAATSLLAALTISAGATGAVLDVGFAQHGPALTSTEDAPLHGTPHDHTLCVLREASAALPSCPSPPLQQPAATAFAQPTGGSGNLAFSYPSQHRSRAPPRS